jgi:hypothetical protein
MHDVGSSSRLINLISREPIGLDNRVSREVFDIRTGAFCSAEGKLEGWNSSRAK